MFKFAGKTQVQFSILPTNLTAQEIPYDCLLNGIEQNNKKIIQRIEPE